jgi:hypothetical protein
MPVSFFNEGPGGRGDCEMSDRFSRGHQLNASAHAQFDSDSRQKQKSRCKSSAANRDSFKKGEKWSKSRGRTRKAVERSLESSTCQSEREKRERERERESQNRK